MTDLTEKNLEAVLLNLTKTGKPITIKPTTWFGNSAKTAQWYTCPNCSKQSPLTLEWVGLTQEELCEIVGVSTNDSDWNVYKVQEWLRKVEAKLKERNT